MAGFSFESLKDRLMGKGAPRDEDDTSARDVQSDGYDDGGAYDDQGYDPNYDDQSYDDQGYDDSNYEDQGYDDQGYDDPNYDGQSYDNQGYDDQNYDDQGYDDPNYDDQGYDDQSYGDQGYDDDSVYGAEDENPENLGYNPDVFRDLDNENAKENADGSYDDGAYDDGDQPYDEGDEGYYEDEGDGGAGFENENASGLLGYVFSNNWVMYVSLVVLPPLGIWLLWRRNKYDITLRTTLSAVSLIWMIIFLILVFSRSNTTPDNTLSGNNSFMSQVPAVSATATATATAEPTAEPSTTPRVNNGSNGTTGDSSVTYVWGTNSGKYYHTLENCGGLTNASKMTLETATARGLLPCPDCAGGTSNTGTTGSTTTSGTTLYATSGGKWYHKDSHCQGMTNAQVVTESNAIKAGKTACPVCIGYYGTPGGKWYHNVSNCQSMTNAITKTKAAWESDGKTACPVCIGGNKDADSTKTPTQTMVYATAKGTYYHTRSDCSGMKGASLGTIARAVSMGKKACPTCVKPANVKVFATKNGKYFHTKANCSGMRNAVYITAETAIQYKKTACPTCAKMFQKTAAGSTGNTGNNTGGGVRINQAANPNNVPTVNTTDTATHVYATKNGKYFHTDKTCSGMTNAKRGTFTAAVKAGKKPCPTCITPAKLTVYATYGGKYYHVNATCSGMTNAFAVKASTAISYNKTACPTCAKVLNKVGKNNQAGNGGANGAGGNNTAANNNTATASTNVYIKLGAGTNNYYHVAAKCAATGMTGGQNVTLEYALSHNYTACPSCKPPSKIQS